MDDLVNHSIPVHISSERKHDLHIKPVRTDRPNRTLITPHINREPLMNIRLWNSRSIRNKTTTCNDYISEHDVDAIFLVETWLATDDPVVIGELKPNGYTFLNIPRGTSNHGGIGVLSKAQLAFRLHPLNAKTVTFEHASILDPNNGVHYIIIYRPHPTKTNGFTLNWFLEEFEDFLQEVSLLTGKLIMLGDFNFHMNEPHRSEVARFQVILSSFGLNQHVTEATHISLIDLIITRENEDFLRTCDVGLYFGSDHKMISCVVQQRKSPPMKATCTMRNYRNLDSSVFVGDLTDRLASTPATSDVNILLEHFNEVSRTVLDTHAPQSTRTRTIRPQAKWYNDEIRAEKREQRRLERKWRKNRLTVNRDSYMVQHEKVISLIEKAKENHYKDVLYNASVKDTFKTLGVLLNKNSRALPTFDTPDELCNKFAQFFTDKVAKIRGNIDSNTIVSPPSIVTRN
ncbi:uncharacterized protein [Amphiura filiformis]|uniref:uncharacterized protein n=1 Tax=Amphiura filiformis TaxID=82378 RepID=UPI003B20D442